MIQTIKKAWGIPELRKKIVYTALNLQIIRNGSVVRTAVIFFYLSNEGISIVENAAALGLPVPRKLKDVLEQLKDDSGKKGE